MSQNFLTETPPEPSPEKAPELPIFSVSEDMKGDLDELLTMLTYKRLAGSKTERKFIREYIRPLGVAQDKFGNLYKEIGDKPSILWSSHTDTVHRNGGRMSLGFAGKQVGVSENDYSNCLGADDGAGVWLMMQLIRANVPGLYIFHRQEESGRNGSEYIAKNHSALLTNIKFAIALDRKEYTSIITHQMSSRCCSEDFAKSLGEQLGMGYKADSTGSYTDTASYVDLIGECTNLSVGYENAHQRVERLDLDFIFKLRDALMKIDPSKLAEKRKAGDKEYKSYGGYRDDEWGNYGGAGGGYQGGSWWQQQRDRWRGTGHVHHGNSNRGDWSRNSYNDGKAYGSDLGPTRPDEYDDYDNTDNSSVDIAMMTRLVKYNPEAVVDLLDSYGIGYAELRDHVLSLHGVVPTSL